jgi:hypothetical protein
MRSTVAARRSEVALVSRASVSDRSVVAGMSPASFDMNIEELGVLVQHDMFMSLGFCVSLQLLCSPDGGSGECSGLLCFRTGASLLSTESARFFAAQTERRLWSEEGHQKGVVAVV